MKLPALPSNKEINTEIRVLVNVRHKPVEQTEDEYIFSDPSADIVREIRKSLLKHDHVMDVTIRIDGRLDNLALDFDKLYQQTT